MPDLVHALVGRGARVESGRDITLHVLHHDDRVVDDDADREHQSEQGEIVQREPEQRHEEEGTDQRHRNGDDRNDGRAPSLQEQDHDQHDEKDRLEDGFLDGVDRLLDELGRIVDDGVLDAGRKATRELIHRGDDALGCRQCVRARPLEDPERHRGIAVEIRIARIVLRGELDAGHVAQPHHRIGGLFHHDVVKFIGVGEAPQRLHRDLKRALLGHRRLIEHAGGNLDVLALQSKDDVGRGQADRLQAVGIDPNAHRIVAAAEDRDRADAVDAGQNIRDRERRVIGNEQGVARLVGRIEVNDQQQVGRFLRHGHADIAHVARQARLRDGNAVLHLHLSDVEIGAEIEAHVD